MKPEQARQILTEASDYISEWKSKLMVVSGNGIDIKDSSAGQFVSMGGPPGEPPLEPTSYTTFLWANITQTETRAELVIENSHGEKILIDEGGVTVNETDWCIIHELNFIESGEYVPSKEAFNHPNDLSEDTNALVSGYFYPTYFDAIEVAPMDINRRRPYPKVTIWRGAYYAKELYSTGFGEDFFRNETTTNLNIKLSIRGYEPAYVDGRDKKLLPIEFNKGQSVGSYELKMRKEDTVVGPAIPSVSYFDEFGDPREEPLYYDDYGTNPDLSSSSVRVGKTPVTVIYNSVPVDSFYQNFYTNPGIITIVAYRKV